jgi:hypothetical protein
MKSAIIPAQITTVEDRIAGNFTLTQILLFLTPLFVTVFVYAVLPNQLHFSLYKFLIIGFTSILCFTLAFRVRGKIVLYWLGILGSYNLRPRYYIFDKNDFSLREAVMSPKDSAPETFIKNADNTKEVTLSIEDSSKLKSLISRSGSTVRFRFKKGGVHVDTFQVSS